MLSLLVCTFSLNFCFFIFETEKYVKPPKIWFWPTACNAPVRWSKVVSISRLTAFFVVLVPMELIEIKIVYFYSHHMILEHRMHKTKSYQLICWCRGRVIKLIKNWNYGSIQIILECHWFFFRNVSLWRHECPVL